MLPPTSTFSLHPTRYMRRDEPLRFDDGPRASNDGSVADSPLGGFDVKTFLDQAGVDPQRSSLPRYPGMGGEADAPSPDRLSGGLLRACRRVRRHLLRRA